MSKIQISALSRYVFAAAAMAAVALAAPGLATAHPGHGVRLVAPNGDAVKPVTPTARRWQAGDHHVHSWYSVSLKPSADPSQPPELIIAGDANNPIATNAAMAAKHGLSWMVATDHGGPNHAKLNRDRAYPELERSRVATPGVLQFWGMELDTPAAEHSSVIVPHTAGERDALFGVESRYNRREPWPADPARDQEAFMLEALRHMSSLPQPPILIANHPSRTATAVGQYGLLSPGELRAWNDTAPKVAIGMEGAPGHQASGMKPDGQSDPEGFRGAYATSPTMGGFDQMTARVGGFWDSMLGEGRRWWITSTSDSHRHYTTGGGDFWPGEYSKTYVKAAHTYDDVLDGLRNGRVFVTLGDLVSEVEVTALTADGRRMAEIGGTLQVDEGSDVTIVIRVRDPAGRNFGGRTPSVSRIDLIGGELTGPATSRDEDSNPTTRVLRRFSRGELASEGEALSATYVLKNVRRSGYIRVRGTNGAELEPQADPAGEDPWSDLWFYANPIFFTVTGRPASAF